MNLALGLGLLAAGVVLLIFGFNASHSFGSDVSAFSAGLRPMKQFGCW